MSQKILGLKRPAKKRGGKPRDGPCSRQEALDHSITIMYGPNALARMARVQKEMDVIHAAGQKKMLETSLRRMFVHPNHK